MKEEKNHPITVENLFPTVHPIQLIPKGVEAPLVKAQMVIQEILIQVQMIILAVANRIRAPAKLNNDEFYCVTIEPVWKMGLAIN
ncbi:MAG: hypothetical protein BRC29_01240 [Nanohaloarchaea archaeon SW_7_43_1]|nr:MAG: hypothetical protein BRC29_01240 [Nanohaloarchaea archaeon SW_7_43_1]